MTKKGRKPIAAVLPPDTRGYIERATINEHNRVVKKGTKEEVKRLKPSMDMARELAAKLQSKFNRGEKGYIVPALSTIRAYVTRRRALLNEARGVVMRAPRRSRQDAEGTASTKRLREKVEASSTVKLGELKPDDVFVVDPVDSDRTPIKYMVLPGEVRLNVDGDRSRPCFYNNTSHWLSTDLDVRLIHRPEREQTGQNHVEERPLPLPLDAQLGIANTEAYKFKQEDNVFICVLKDPCESVLSGPHKSREEALDAARSLATNLEREVRVMQCIACIRCIKPDRPLIVTVERESKEEKQQ
jgi:hypothetical protein